MRTSTLVLALALVFLPAAPPALAASEADVPPLVRAFVDYRKPNAAGRSKSIAGRPVIPGVRVDANVEYGRAGWESLKLDLYQPSRRPRRPIPAVLFIHGGGWALGDKAEGTFAGYLATRGYVVASINYRLCWLAKFPAAVEDCKAAVRWMRANARRLSVDPERIGVWGASAGGHLAMMVGCAGRDAGLEGTSGTPGVSSHVNAVVSYFGPADLAGEFANPLSLGGQIVRFFMGPFRPPVDFVKASPVHHVGAGDPPLLLVHGDSDWLVPIRQSEIMLDAYRAAGLQARLVRVRNADHGFAPKNLFAPVTPNSNERWQHVIGFFDRHLKGIVP